MFKRAMPKVSKPKEAPRVTDPETGEILLPMKSLEDELRELGLI